MLNQKNFPNVYIECWVICFLIPNLNKSDINPLINILFSLIRKKDHEIKYPVLQSFSSLIKTFPEFIFKNYFRQIFNLLINSLSISKPIEVEKILCEVLTNFIEAVLEVKENFENSEELINLFLGSFVRLFQEQENSYEKKMVFQPIFILILKSSQNLNFESVFKSLINYELND